MNKSNKSASLFLPDSLPDSHHPARPAGHPEAAKSLMVTKVCTAVAGDTVTQVLKKLHAPKHPYDTVDYTYILDSAGHLEGVVSIKELLGASGEARLAQLMQTKLATVHPFTDQERVAHTALKYNIKAVPVVEAGGKFLGVVPSDALLNILQWEHAEDLFRMSGVHASGKTLRTLVQQGVFQMSRARIPSLIIGALGGLLLTGVVQKFQDSLETELLLAFFIPILLYVCSAVGTQTGAILVRTLMTETVRLRSYIFRELAVGAILATLLAAFVFGVVTLWFGNTVVAFTVALSLGVGTMTAVLLGIFIPWSLAKFHQDPAVSGGPFITVAQDTLTLVIYFTVANLILL